MDKQIKLKIKPVMKTTGYGNKLSDERAPSIIFKNVEPEKFNEYDKDLIDIDGNIYKKSDLVEIVRILE